MYIYAVVPSSESKKKTTQNAQDFDLGSQLLSFLNFKKLSADVGFSHVSRHSFDIVPQVESLIVSHFFLYIKKSSL